MSRIVSKAWLIAVLIFMPAVASAGIKDVTVTATGTGATDELALRDAMSKAVSQVRGIDIATSSSIDAMMLEAESSSNGKDSSISAIGMRQTETSKINIEGYVKSYSILGRSKNAEQMFVVKIRAVVPEYQGDASTNRKKIALTQTKVLSATRLFDVTRQTEIRDMLDQAIESQLVQSRKLRC